MNRAIIASIFLLSAVAAPTQSTSTQQPPPQVYNQQTATPSPAASQVTIPSNTQIQVRVNEDLSSETSQAGQAFSGTLAQPVVVNGLEVFPKGAIVTGKVMDATKSGRLQAPGTLDLTVNSIRLGSRSANVTTDVFHIQGESHTRSNTTKIGAGAALGAIIGGIAGGGKGAAIGAGVGAAAGTAGAAATGAKPATVESEAVLTFVTSASSSQVSVPASSSSTPVTDENSDEYPPVLKRRNTDSTVQSSTAPTATQVPTTPAQSPGIQRPPAQANAAPSITSAFSLRDKRVISNCVHENSAALPASVLRRDANLRLFSAGDQIPTTLQSGLRSLPYACEKQLAPLPQNEERVVFNAQALLIDASGRVLDSFSLQP